MNRTFTNTNYLGAKHEIFFRFKRKDRHPFLTPPLPQSTDGRIVGYCAYTSEMRNIEGFGRLRAIRSGRQ